MPSLANATKGDEVIDPVSSQTIHPTLLAASVQTLLDLEASDSGVLFNQTQGTFDALIGKIVTALNHSATESAYSQPAARMTLRLMLYRVLDQAEKKVPAPPKETMLDSLLTLFITLDHLPSQVQPIWPRNEKGRYLEIAWAAWRKTLKENAIQTEGDILRAFISIKPALQNYRVSGLTFLNFNRLTPLQAEAIVVLSRQIPVSMQFDRLHERTDLYQPLDRILNYFEKEGQTGQLDISFGEPYLADDPIRKAYVNSLFQAIPEHSSNQDDRVSLKLFNNRSDQVRATLNAIHSRIAKGDDPKSIAIVAPDLQAVRPYLREGIVELGLPIAYHRAVRVFQAPCFRWLFRLAEALQPPLTIITLAHLAREANAFGLGPDGDLTSAESTLRKAGKERLLDPQKLLDALDQESRSSVAAWIDWLSEWQDSRQLADWMDFFKEKLESIQLPAIHDTNDQRHFSLSWQALNTVLQILDEWSERQIIPEARNLTGIAFLKWLQATIDATIRIRSSPEPESIAVVSLEEACQMPFDTVYILDMVEGLVPQVSEGNRLLRDHEKNAINITCRFPLIENAAESFHRQRMAFLHVLLSGQTVYLSAPLSDEKGEELTPSAFFLECAKHGEVERHSLPVPKPGRDKWIGESLKLMQGSIPPENLENDIRETLFRVDKKGRIESSRKRFMDTADAKERDAFADNYTGKLANLPDNFIEYLPEKFSPTSLDDYANCPFKFFLNYVLHVESWDAWDVDPDMKHVGSALHRTMETLIRPGLQVSIEDVEKKAAQLMANHLTYQVRDGAAVTRDLITPLADKWGRDIIRTLDSWLSKTGPLEPWKLEAEFGSDREGSIHKELIIPVGDGPPVRLSGRIDRIDLGEAMVMVIDYKASKSDGKYRDKLKDEHFAVSDFQMPIYLLAIKSMQDSGEFQSLSGVRKLSAVYAVMGKAAIKEKSLDLDDPNQAAMLELDLGKRAELVARGLPNIANRIVDLVTRMRNGDFQITPRDCSYCSFADICRIGISDTKIEFKEME